MKDAGISCLAHSGVNLQEDVCVMMNVDGKLRLVSGAVLFPQRWHLLEKMGMDMRSIHLPVPLYADVIGSAVEHFMNRLKVDKPVWRANWAIVDDPTLFQPLNEVSLHFKYRINFAGMLFYGSAC